LAPETVLRFSSKATVPAAMSVHAFMRERMKRIKLGWALALLLIALGAALTAHRLAASDHERSANPCQTLPADEICMVLPTTSR
jgi:hypothetical protein